MGRNQHFATDLSVQMGARYGLRRPDPEVDKYRGKVVKLADLSGSHPDFNDPGDRYYVAGRSPYDPKQLELKGIPGHTNGSVHTSPANVKPVREKLKKYVSDY